MNFAANGFAEEWELLSAVFGLDLLTYAILSNHLHVILRTRPDVVATWSDREVARRWLRLFPGQRLEEHLGEPTEADVKMLAADAKRLEKIRVRLSDISWFMRALAEPIARMANRQDQVTGRFWEGRFKAQKIVDASGLLASAMYVDLNPVRAAMAATPEQSKYTSAYDRIKALNGAEIDSAACESVPIDEEETRVGSESIAATSPAGSNSPSVDNPTLVEGRAPRTKRAKNSRRIARDGWLAPLELLERGAPGPRASRSGVRASDKGFLPMKVANYLRLLDWTGRQGRADKRGQIPANLAPILDRIGINGSMWCDLVWGFKRYFGRSRAAGRAANMRQDAIAHGRCWTQGEKNSVACFGG